MNRFFIAALAATLCAGIATAQELKPLNSDSEPDRMDWSDLDAKLGALAKPPEGLKVGGVSKTLTNEYWRSLGEGYQKFADKLGVSVAYQAAQSEGDQLGQLTIAPKAWSRRATMFCSSLRRLTPISNRSWNRPRRPMSLSSMSTTP